jgi:hypothetical protein
MTIQLKVLTRDRFCNYCAMSEYRQDYDGREFYHLTSNDDIFRGRMIVSICEVCTRELYQVLGETVKPE